MTEKPNSTKAFGTIPQTIVGLSRMVELALDEVDLTLAQYRLLGFCANGPTTPTEVAVWLSVKKQSVTSQLDALVQRGFLERESDDDDRRRSLHVVTPLGRKQLANAELAIETYFDAVLSTLTAADRKRVTTGLSMAGTALGRIWARAKDSAPPRPLTGWMSTK